MMEQSHHTSLDFLTYQGRAARTNVSGRFEAEQRALFDDGWQSLDEDREKRQIRTTLHRENPRHALTRNQSPDVPFDRSINPYRGCEHGCIYCFARPTHTYMGLSAGLDFETELFAKDGLAEKLQKELAKPGYKPQPIALGTNTDPYQPVEREENATRSLLEVMDATNHPVTIVTKSALILRDLDILKSLASRQLVKVALSVTTLDPKVARLMEPRAATPQRRLDAIRLLSDAGIPVAAMVAPIVPGLTDHELEKLLAAVAHAGAEEASYILLRLPLEVKELFAEWLEDHFPDRKDKVLSRLAAMRGGRLNDARFGSRMKGEGVEATLIKTRFARAARAAGLIPYDRQRLRTDLFIKPSSDVRQLQLI